MFSVVYMTAISHTLISRQVIKYKQWALTLV